MKMQITHQEKVRHHSPINKNKYRSYPLERRRDKSQAAKDDGPNSQAAKDDGRQVSPGPSRNTPHLSIDMEPEKGWCTMSRVEHWHRDSDRVIKCTCSRTESSDWQDHLDEQIMIARTGP